MPGEAPATKSGGANSESDQTRSTMSFDDALMKAISNDSYHTFDNYVVPGLRIWELCAILGAITIVIIVAVCCFTKVRIPRTKRQIELSAAKRKTRKKHHQKEHSVAHSQEERAQTIVMNTLNHPAGRTSQGSEHRESPALIQNSRQTAV